MLQLQRKNSLRVFLSVCVIQLEQFTHKHARIAKVKAKKIEANQPVPRRLLCLSLSLSVFSVSFYLAHTCCIQNGNRISIAHRHNNCQGSMCWILARRYLQCSICHTPRWHWHFLVRHCCPCCSCTVHSNIMGQSICTFVRCVSNSNEWGKFLNSKAVAHLGYCFDSFER